MKTVLLLETRMTGHRPSYLRRITHIALNNAMQVIIAMPESCFKHPVAQRLVASDTNRVQAILCKQAINEVQSTMLLGMLHREYQCAAFYKEAIRKATQMQSIDLAIISTFDDAALISALRLPAFGTTPWLGIVMKQRFHFSIMGANGPPASKMLRIKRNLFIRLLKHLKKSARILTIDESLYHFITSVYPELEARIGLIPDPVDDRRQMTRPDLRKELGIPDDAFVILAYGALRKRKGVRVLLDVMHQLPDNIHALLVGTQSPEIADSVNAEKHRPLLEAGRVHQVNRYIDVSEDPNFFIPADAVWLAYQNYFAMSAVMVQAAQYERPSVATHNGLVGTLTSRYQTGVVVDTSDYDELSRAVMKLVNKEIQPETKQYEAFATAFSLTAFEDALLDAANKLCITDDG